MTEPLLNLDAVAPERPTVRVKTKDHRGGLLYELAVFKDLSITEQQTLYSGGNRMVKLVERKNELDPEEKDELENIVNKMVQIVLPDLPDALLEPMTDDEKALPKEEQPSKLQGGQKLQIVETFTIASPELKAAVEEAKKERQKGRSRTR